MSRRKPTADLRSSLLLPGFIPRRKDLDALFQLLGGDDKDLVALVERALARAGADSAARAIEWHDARPPLRGRLCRLVGRVAQTHPDATYTTFLLRSLSDEDAKTRRNAIIALGKPLPSTAVPVDGAPTAKDIEHRLLQRWDEESLVAQRSLAATLGKVGAKAAFEHLKRVDTNDAELRRIVDEAVLKLDRTRRRPQTGRVSSDRAFKRPMVVRFRCRAGLESLLREELDASGLANLDARVVQPGVLEGTSSASIASLQNPRIALRFGFPLDTGPSGQSRAGSRERDKRIEDAVVHAMTSSRALDILRASTSGPIRYRIEWASGGHRRALTWRCAQRISKACSELVNDPSETLWEVAVVDSDETVECELWPRGLPDPRFAYRKRDVPGASHPTIAAALVRAGGVRNGEVVWDPFVGSGTELIERAIAGRCRALIGTDLRADAIAAAHVNVSAAKIDRATLLIADARSYWPNEPVTLIVSNPPMGRRVLDRHELEPLFDSCIRHFANVMAPSGRLVWMSPIGDRTRGFAERAGFSCTLDQRVDMGGFDASLQRFVLNKSR